MRHEHAPLLGTTTVTATSPPPAPFRSCTPTLPPARRRSCPAAEARARPPPAAVLNKNAFRAIVRQGAPVERTPSRASRLLPLATAVMGLLGCSWMASVSLCVLVPALPVRTRDRSARARRPVPN